MQLTVDLDDLAGGIGIGDSVSINGVCLTVTKLDSSIASFDVSRETLAKSNLVNLKPSSPVNVERALKVDSRLDGHIVQGHIDSTAVIQAIDKHGQFANIRFAVNPELLDQMVAKGSVAVDGISLTIAELDENSFSAAVIPETLKKTTLGKAKVGDTSNIETDILVRIIKRQLDKILPQNEKLTVKKLRMLGF